MGVTGEIAPEVRLGVFENNTNFLICSDGFRHVLTEKELYEELSAEKTKNKAAMQKQLRQLIEIVKSRNENDNITAAVFRAEM